MTGGGRGDRRAIGSRGSAEARTSTAARCPEGTAMETAAPEPGRRRAKGEAALAPLRSAVESAGVRGAKGSLARTGSIRGRARAGSRVEWRRPRAANGQPGGQGPTWGTRPGEGGTRPPRPRRDDREAQGPRASKAAPAAGASRGPGSSRATPLRRDVRRVRHPGPGAVQAHRRTPGLLPALLQGAQGDPGDARGGRDYRERLGNRRVADDPTRPTKRTLRTLTHRVASLASPSRRRDEV